MDLGAEETASLFEAPVLVTGAGGFVGGHCVRALLNAGVRPRTLVRSSPEGMRRRYPGADIRTGTIASAGDTFDGVKTVFNFAYDMRADGIRNLRDFDSLLANLGRCNVERLVHASSIVVHDGWPNAVLDETSALREADDPTSYHSAKILIERRIREAVSSGALASAVILRPSLVYGPGGWMWTTETVRRLRRGPVLLPEPPHDHPQDAPFGLCHTVHAEDLALAAIRSSLLQTDRTATYIVSDPNPVTWEEYYSVHAREIGVGTVKQVPFAELQARIPPPPMPGSKTGPSLAARASSVARRMVGSATIDAISNKLRTLRQEPQREQIPERWLFDLYSATGHVDASKAARDLGFAPAKSLDQRVRDMADELRAV